MYEESIKKKIEIQKLAEEAHLKIGGRSTVEMSVGLGKSVLAINRIKAHFNKNKNSKILFCGARTLYLRNFIKELKKFDCEDYVELIEFQCIQSLKNFIGWWDLIIIDESHKNADQSLEFILKILKINPNVEILCLTGTTLKQHGIYFICPISYTKLINDSVEEKILNDYKITIIKHPITSKERNKYNFFYNKYNKSSKFQNGEYPVELMYLKNVLKNLKSKEDIVNYIIEKYLYSKKCLIYTGTIDQAERMKYDKFHSKMKEDEKWKVYEKFINGEILHLTNVNSIKESVSIPNLQYCIIMSPDASKTSMEQIIGRILRLMIGDIGSIIILCAENTIEEKYVEKALTSFNKNKIFYKQIEEL